MAATPPTLPDLNALDAAALKALILAQHENLVAQHETLVSRETEIENLKLLILKLRRMQFGRKWNFGWRIWNRRKQQVLLRRATHIHRRRQAVSQAEGLHGARCRIIYRVRRKPTNQSRRHARSVAARCASSQKTYRNSSSLCQRGSR
jgi:hypothetical protein